jgi:hypothetical protein
MRNKIKVKTKLYLNNLGKFLEISSFNKININHIELISEYLQKYQEPEIFRDLLKDLLDFKNVINYAIKNMRIIYMGIIKSGNIDADSLNDIILNIRLLNDKVSLSEKDKDNILGLMTEYSKTLDEKLKGNNDLKNMVYGGSIITLSILTYAFYKALGGKKGEEILKNTTKKLLTNVKFVDSIRFIGTKG